LGEEPSANDDADDAIEDLYADSDEEESDDEEELMRELERIRKERAVEKAARDEREKAEQVNSYGR
jgi:protein CWC15